MTMKRMLVVLAVVAVGLVAGSLLYWGSLPKTPFQAKYARVRRGMTVEEVHGILGGPNRDYGVEAIFCELLTRKGIFANLCEEYGHPRDGFTGPTLCYPPESQETAFVFFANGLVTHKRYVQGDWQEPTAFQSFFKLSRW
jgi:hypothetical protein